MTDYCCPPECEHEPGFDPIRCPLSRQMEVCLVHTIAHPTDEKCPICGAYIAAGL